MGQSQKQTYSVLLADDSVQDRLLMRIALHRHPRLRVVGEVEDGFELISYLNREGKFQDDEKYPFPDLLILDLKMPRKTGYEVLEWLQDQAYNDLFVTVVSGSCLPEDQHRSLALGADAFYIKTANRKAREDMACSIGNLMTKSRQQKARRA